MLRNYILNKLHEEELDRAKRAERTKAVADALMRKRLKGAPNTSKDDARSAIASVKRVAAENPSNKTGRADPEMRAYQRKQRGQAGEIDREHGRESTSLVSIIRNKIEERGKGRSPLKPKGRGGNGGKGTRDTSDGYDETEGWDDGPIVK
jgi:hypothetical protein